MNENETCSPTLEKLFAAVSLMQKALRGATANSENPFFNSAYADLEAVWNAIREPLTSNNLCVIQTLEKCENGVIIKTTLAHSSGQWISSSLFLKPVKPDPQSVGSAISYGRRYALAAIVGVYQTDDDANLATHHRSEPAPQQHVSPQPQRITSPQPNFGTGGTNHTTYKPISDAQIKRLFAMGKGFAWDEMAFKAVAKSKWNVEHLSQLSRAQYDELCGLVSNISYLDWETEQKFG